MITELLSPAKNKETAIAAINCGADAVYIGASCFGARQKASNTLDDIGEVVNYAHKFRVKIYVTVNTILTDDELEDAVSLVKKLDAIGVDAIIVQDMGLVKKLCESGCNIPLHISTQCDNRAPEKIAFFNKTGFSRVVLARETSLSKIEQIHKDNPGLELESFVHGALCVSYSGQCYLSQYIGGRSANRGECAQPCRKKYTIIDENSNIISDNIYALCLKDFNASDYIKEMVDAGVYSFKIEGRLKDVGYVKNITAYYRELLDKYSQKSSSGKCFYPFAPNPEKSFNRGFTDYFIVRRGDCFNLKSPKSQGEYLGKVKKVKNGNIEIDTAKEIFPQDGLCYYTENGLEGFLVNKVTDKLIFPNRIINISIGDDIYRNVDAKFEKELLLPARRQIGITVIFKDNILTITDEDEVSIDIKIHQTEKARNKEKMAETFAKQFSKTGESDFYIKDIKILSELPFMAVSAINDLRRSSFAKLMDKRLETYKRERQKPIVCSQYYKAELDYRENVHNSEAKAFYEKCGSKVEEMSFETVVPDRQVELMRTKHCIKYALNMCKSSKKLFLKDEFGKVYPLEFDCNKCEMSVLTNSF